MSWQEAQKWCVDWKDWRRRVFNTGRTKDHDSYLTSTGDSTSTTSTLHDLWPILTAATQLILTYYENWDNLNIAFTDRLGDSSASNKAPRMSQHFRISSNLRDVTISVDQSVSQSVSQSISQSVDQSVNQSISQPVSQSVNQDFNAGSQTATIPSKMTT